MTQSTLPTDAPARGTAPEPASSGAERVSPVLAPEEGDTDAGTRDGHRHRTLADRLSRARAAALIVAVLLTVLAVGVSIVIGTAGITLADVWKSVQLSVFGGTLETEFARTFSIITELRFPRALLAFIAGAGLSLAGALMQGLLRNPLVSPFTLGVSPAAAFGAALAITISGATTLPAWVIILSALGVSLAVSAVVLGLASVKRMAVATLLLLGIAITQLFEALTAGLQFVASENTLQAIVRWTFGSVNDATWNDVQIVGAVVLVALPVALWFAKDLNAVAFAGDDAAKSLGVNVTALRVGLIGVSVLLAAVVVSFCGVIGFVGLVGPHIARLIIGSDHRYLLPFSVLTGGLLLLVADTVGRTILAPAVIPVGIVVAFIGAPIFINLILTRRSSLR
ncbi:iron ABC transporter permease [Microbacterium sp. KUDC0406]|uniref:FecCD family ABC transporter permease n=1 Tax=Microbacterium sp. KUDC0406 TaxID=2909588 RepID=UPI001F1BEE92|nr:iron ABC transporter permease [Microbacterium sp. KUDC0406]UJP10501.1 iron ABC transporter permease [Microbacterium sp. KUDC0406]